MNQSILLSMEPINLDKLWLRAALKECVAYHEHGIETEIVNGLTVCWNCGNTV